MNRVPGPTRASRPGRLPLGAAALALALALTGCSGGSGDEATTTGAAPSSSADPTTEAAPTSQAPAGPAEARTVTATEGEMYIELSTEDLSAGSYTFEVVNEGSATHDFVVERDGEDVAATETIDPGGTSTLTVDLAPGEYVFYCSVGNHRAQGMEVTVTVS
ncbi:MAG: cupredoxin domain-containing protein [Actinomycetes bacterium]